MSLAKYVRTAAEIEAMRTSGQMLATVLEYLRGQIAVGQITKELADIAAQELKRLGGKPAFLGYQGFPDVICISVNEEIVHGIPGSRMLANGDVVGLDFGVSYDRMITDGAITVSVGHPMLSVEHLIKGTEAALAAGIGEVRAGARIGDISAAIERRLRQDNLGVIEDLIGHGVGHKLHEEPGIPNYGQAGRGPKLLAGMTIAIEPMASMGGYEIGQAADGWTILTRDASLAAQFEHTVLVTERGAEILTKA